MPYLSYISDTDLECAAQYVLNAAQTGIQDAATDFGRNTIDPFSLTFEMAGFNVSTVSAWEQNEKARQAQKTLVQAIGDFHQMVLGSVHGWVNMGVGNQVDLVCASRKIVAEVKNKHNTVTGKNLVNLYDGLENLVMPNTSVYKGYTAYYVEIIPKGRKTYKVPFQPSDPQTSTRRAANQKILKIDGKSFYALATNSPTALKDLYAVLPNVISAISSFSYSSTERAAMQLYFSKAFA